MTVSLIVRGDIGRLRQEAASCRACPLWRRATQTVFGEGSANARLMFVGEQPGNREDLTGRPFVGPAGRILVKALVESGIDRSHVYLTNAVKHFKFEPRGKRRLHKKPSAGEIDACRFWLDAELEAVNPRLVVALGATAVTSVTHRSLAIGGHRGNVVQTALGRSVLITTHPSSLLRIPEDGERRKAYSNFVDDLRVAARYLTAAAPSAAPAK